MGIATNGRGFFFGEAQGNPNRLSSKAYGVYITGESVYNAPARDCEMIVIPGRNGALFRDNKRYENIEVTYKCGMYADTQANFATNLQLFRNDLTLRTQDGYQHLYDDYHTDEFRMAVFKSGIDVDAVANSTAGEFDIVFDCKPQRFLISGDSFQSMTSGGTLSNPTDWNAQPLISFQTSTGNGTLTFSYQAGVQGNTITVSGAPTNTTIYIDCEVGEMYKIENDTITPLNNYVSFGTNIPVLKPYTATVTFSGLNTVKIKPRWWRL